jgi:hypothetical protein
MDRRHQAATSPSVSVSRATLWPQAVPSPPSRLRLAAHAPSPPAWDVAPTVRVPRLFGSRSGSGAKNHGTSDRGRGESVRRRRPSLAGRTDVRGFPRARNGPAQYVASHRFSIFHSLLQSCRLVFRSKKLDGLTDRRSDGPIPASRINRLGRELHSIAILALICAARSRTGRASPRPHRGAAVSGGSRCDVHGRRRARPLGISRAARAGRLSRADVPPAKCGRPPRSALPASQET